jgi:dTDP-4-amino-4,6-dideoxygalactose transaminase
VVRWYREALAEGPLPGLRVPFSTGDYGAGSHHIFVVLLPEGTDRQGVMASLRADGIQSSVHYPPTHRFSAYARHAPCSP